MASFIFIFNKLESLDKKGASEVKTTSAEHDVMGEKKEKPEKKGGKDKKKEKQPQ